VRGASDGERVRRRDALRALAEAAGYDALVLCGRGDEFVRGRIQWASDVFQWAGWGYLAISGDGRATFFADPLAGFADAEPERRWVDEVVLTQQPGRGLAEILPATGTIGVVGLGEVAAPAHVAELEAAAPGLALVDATDGFDDIRAIKSAEEISNLEETSAILRRVFAALEAELRPQTLIRDVLAEAHRLCRQHGCVDGIAMLSRPPMTSFTHGLDEPLEADDVFVVDLEWGGPSGYWLELRRCYSFGPPPDDVRRLWEVRVETFEACLQVMRPGTSSEEILAARDRIYAGRGLSAEGSVVYSAHGIGIDSLEPPWVPGKHRELREGMVISLHPDLRLDEAARARAGLVSVGDNVLVTPGGGRRLTYDVEEWVILDR
jgi:Xaa-Pro aminopeptidase